jgi:hypothetical protein
MLQEAEKLRQPRIDARTSAGSWDFGHYKKSRKCVKNALKSLEKSQNVLYG